SHSHLERRGRVEVARAEPYPEPGEHRGEDEDEPGIDRLVPARGMLAVGPELADEGAIGVVERERVERRALLLEAAPEEHGAEEEHDDDADLFLRRGIQAAEQQHVAE